MIILIINNNLIIITNFNFVYIYAQRTGSASTSRPPSATCKHGQHVTKVMRWDMESMAGYDTPRGSLQGKT